MAEVKDHVNERMSRPQHGLGRAVLATVPRRGQGPRSEIPQHGSFEARNPCEALSLNRSRRRIDLISLSGAAVQLAVSSRGKGTSLYPTPMFQVAAAWPSATPLCKWRSESTATSA
jgi:hypothetical protein